jgi:nucleoside-diphosphate-sugar epimerase
VEAARFRLGDCLIAGLMAAAGRPVVADALDPESVADAVARAEPEVIVHQLTAIPHALDMRHFARDFAQTNRLCTEGIYHLLAAGCAVGVRRSVAQSYAPAVFARVGGPVKAEQDPVDASPPNEVRITSRPSSISSGR